MEDINRIMILLLILGLLYSLYYYKQKINDEQENHHKAKTETKPKLIKHTTEKVVPQIFDDISQLSLGSLKDYESKHDSLFESESNETGDI